MDHLTKLFEDILGEGNAPTIKPMYSKAQVRRKSPQMWECPNGKVVGYNPHKSPEGTWEVALYKPIKGAPGRVEMTYHREFKTRKAAKRRALKLFADNNPKWAAKHRWWLVQDGIVKG